MQATERRFWAKVEKTDASGCWNWTAATTLGYGVLRGVGLAHRYAWTLEHGQIPDGMTVKQRCGNRRCVRVAHLYLASRKDTVHDNMTSGRHYSPFVEASVEARRQYAARAKDACDANRTRYQITPEQRRKGHITRGCDLGVKRRRTSHDLSKEWKKVLLSDPCVYCGGVSVEADHIFPFARGGDHDWHNRAPACLACNRSKNDIPLLKFMMRRRKSASVTSYAGH